jgi:hypothetical protein
MGPFADPAGVARVDPRRPERSEQDQFQIDAKLCAPSAQLIAMDDEFAKLTLAAKFRCSGVRSQTRFVAPTSNIGSHKFNRRLAAPCLSAKLSLSAEMFPGANFQTVCRLSLYWFRSNYCAEQSCDCAASA